MERKTGKVRSGSPHPTNTNTTTTTENPPRRSSHLGLKKSSSARHDVKGSRFHKPHELSRGALNEAFHRSMSGLHGRARRRSKSSEGGKSKTAMFRRSISRSKTGVNAAPTVNANVNSNAARGRSASKPVGSEETGGTFIKRGKSLPGKLGKLPSGFFHGLSLRRRDTAAPQPPAAAPKMERRNSKDKSQQRARSRSRSNGSARSLSNDKLSLSSKRSRSNDRSRETSHSSYKPANYDDDDDDDNDGVNDAGGARAKSSTRKGKPDNHGRNKDGTQQHKQQQQQERRPRSNSNPTTANANRRTSLGDAKKDKNTRASATQATTVKTAKQTSRGKVPVRRSEKKRVAPATQKELGKQSHDKSQLHHRDEDKHSKKQQAHQQKRQQQSNQHQQQPQAQEPHHHHHNQQQHKQPPSQKPRSKSMPPLSTPFTFHTIYPSKRNTEPVSPLPSVDSSWRYQAVKLTREMKMRYKREKERRKARHGAGASSSSSDSGGGAGGTTDAAKMEPSKGGNALNDQHEYNDDSDLERKEMSARPQQEEQQQQHQQSRHQRHPQKESPERNPKSRRMNDKNRNKRYRQPPEQPRRTQRRRKSRSSFYDRNERRYRSKSCDSIFSKPSRRQHDEAYQGALVPYSRGRYNNYHDAYDRYGYDNHAYWEDELYNNHRYEYDIDTDDHDDNMTPESLSLQTSKYGRHHPRKDSFEEGEDEDGDWGKSENWNYGRIPDPVASLNGSEDETMASPSTGSDEDVVSEKNKKREKETENATGTKSNKREEKKATSTATRGRKSKRREDEEDRQAEFDISLSVNNLEEKSTNSSSSTSISGASSISKSKSSSSKHNSNAYNQSFMVPPLHSEVRANKPAPPFSPKLKKTLVRNAMAVASSMLHDDIEASPNQFEVSEVTLPNEFHLVPPLHSAIRAKKPAKKFNVNSGGGTPSGDHHMSLPNLQQNDDDPKRKKYSSIDSRSTASCSATDMVSELTMPSTLKNAIRAPPPLSEVLKRKPSDKVAAKLAEESSNNMEVAPEDSRRHPQQQQEAQHPPLQQPLNTPKMPFAPRPPPPRPPPRNRPTKQSSPANAKHHQRKNTPPTTAPPPESFEELTFSFFSKPLPPLDEEIPDLPPAKSQEYESKPSRSFDHSSSVMKLNVAAAQLLSMQSGGTAKTAPNRKNEPVSLGNSNPSSPNAQNFSRSNSQPVSNPQFQNLARSYSQPASNINPPLFQSVPRSTSQPDNNYNDPALSRSCPGLLNPGNFTSRSRRVEQMPYTDDFGDSGLYSGEVNEDCRPNGNGKMKYDNGVFFEGKWKDGAREGNAIQRERMLSGFTSWKGVGSKGGGKTVHGMTWIDRFGKAGQYTGDVNGDNVPHGKGIMRFDFGLIAEGEWVNGILVDGGQQLPGVGGAGAGVTVMGATVVGGMPNATVFPGMMGGMTVMPPTFPMVGNMSMGVGNLPYGNISGGQAGPPSFIRRNTGA